MPNKGRGEVEFTVDGRTYVLRPSFETMAAIEDAIDKGAVELLERGRAVPVSLKMRDVVTVLWLAAKRSKNRDVPAIEDLGESLRRELGLVKALQIMLHFLGNSLCSDEQRALAEGGVMLEEAANDTKDADPSSPSEESPGIEGSPE